METKNGVLELRLGKWTKFGTFLFSFWNFFPFFFVFGLDCLAWSFVSCPVLFYKKKTCWKCHLVGLLQKVCKFGKRRTHLYFWQVYSHFQDKYSNPMHMHLDLRVWLCTRFGMVEIQMNEVVCFAVESRWWRECGGNVMRDVVSSPTMATMAMLMTFICQPKLSSFQRFHFEFQRKDSISSVGITVTWRL